MALTTTNVEPQETTANPDGHGWARTSDLSRVKRRCARLSRGRIACKWAGYDASSERSVFGVFAVVSAVFCTLRGLKVQLESLLAGRRVHRVA
jgi:hypothetical protein